VNISQGSVATHLRCGETFRQALLEIHWWVCWWTNFDNQPACNKVTGNNVVAGTFSRMQLSYPIASLLVDVCRRRTQNTENVTCCM